jgi:hypothetical protein
MSPPSPPLLASIASCLVIFFSALAGVGYVDPDATALPAAEFIPGSPVFDAGADQLELARVAMLAEQKELERSWQRKKRPKDVSRSLLILARGYPLVLFPGGGVRADMVGGW